MQSNRFFSPQRAAVALSAFVALAVLGMLQCPLLSIDAATRGALELFAGGLVLLCVSVLIEELIGDRLRDLARRMVALRAAH